tara:strand:- start:42008 stop:42415 length:408 start_codon:yes stop_codon:yes gene_type:complete
MEIELATLEDVEEISRINRMLNHGRNIWSDRGFIKEMVDYHNYFVLKNGRVCGAIGIEVYEEEAEIVTLAIEKDSRGLGFGRKLVDFVIDEARGVDTELLVVGSARKYKAEDFYLKCGFKLDYSDDEYHVFTMKL